VNLCSEYASPKTEIPHMLTVSIKEQLLWSHSSYSSI